MTILFIVGFVLLAPFCINTAFLLLQKYLFNEYSYPEPHSIEGWRVVKSKEAWFATEIVLISLIPLFGWVLILAMSLSYFWKYVVMYPITRFSFVFCKLQNILLNIFEIK